MYSKEHTYMPFVCSPFTLIWNDAGILEKSRILWPQISASVPVHMLTTCLLFILAFSLPIPPASHSSAVDITSCLLQPSFPPGQPPSVVFATPPPPQMNPTPQPRQVGLPTAHPPHSTPTAVDSAPLQKNKSPSHIGDSSSQVIKTDS